MNYIVEGNINFYDMLNESDSDSNHDVANDSNDVNDSVNDSDSNYCLITGEKLDKNHVTLSCNHTFNFVPLYNEVKMQKLNSSRVHYEYYGLKLNQIKCPYCRTIHNTLLPNILLNDNIKVLRGVNTPAKFCMKFHGCSYKYKSGKSKGEFCKKNGFFKGDNCLCFNHHKHYEKNSYKDINVTKSNKKSKQNKCKAILKSGKRKGEKCNSCCDGDYCKRHSN